MFFEVKRNRNEWVTHCMMQAMWVTHGMIKTMWVTHGMSKATWMTHGMMRATCQAHRKEGDKCEWIERNKKKTKKQKKRKRERERKKKEKEKGESRRASSPNFRRSDGRNSSDQEVKYIYSMRATLQEVGILPTWVYFHHKG